jgi:hypothetical protein
MQLTTTVFGLLASSVCVFIWYIKTENVPLNLNRGFLFFPRVTHLLKEPENWSIRPLEQIRTQLRRPMSILETKVMNLVIDN